MNDSLGYSKLCMHLTILTCRPRKNTNSVPCLCFGKTASPGENGGKFGLWCMFLVCRFLATLYTLYLCILESFNALFHNKFLTWHRSRSSQNKTDGHLGPTGMFTVETKFASLDTPIQDHSFVVIGMESLNWHVFKLPYLMFYG